MASDVKKILFPVDFSRHSLFALDQAVFLARLFKAELLLLHVIEEHAFPVTVATKIFSSGSQGKFQQEQTKLALQSVIKEKIPAEIDVSTLVRKGKVYKTITDTAKEKGVSFIVMGTHGASGMQELLVGSNASKVVKTSAVPVITIREKLKRRGFKKIVIPIDLTQETTQKVKAAIEVANYFDSNLYVISILMTDDKQVKQKLEARLEKVKKFVERSNIYCETELLKGESIVQKTFNYAYSIDADLIVIMAQQELKVTEMLWGSQAEQIVNHSRIPVMSINAVRKRSETQWSFSS